MEKLPRAPNASLESASFEKLAVCLEGTRSGVLETIQNWQTDSKSRVFWLNGLAGTGKTTIARTLGDRNTDKNKLIAGFFFSRNDTLCSDHALVFPTLILQLAHLNAVIKKALMTVLRENSDWRSLTLGMQYKKLISEPLKALDTAGHPTMTILFKIGRAHV